jgi:hypothetical protein
MPEIDGLDARDGEGLTAACLELALAIEAHP